MSIITSRIVQLTLGATMIAAACAAAVAGSSSPKPKKAGAAVPIPAIQIIPQVPTELNPQGGGAPAATLAQAAAFAWQEFIALSWPAATVDGQGNPLRETPDTSCLLGDPRQRCSAQPLTWQTLRGKAEIFPASNRTPDSDYDLPPNYNRYHSNIGACPGQAAGPAAWVNLDETTEISESAMFAGIAPTDTSVNAMPQLIRFMAKANRKEFDYYATARGLPGGYANFVATTATNVPTVGTPPPGSTQYVSLPTNTIELKAAWRMLTPAELSSKRFHTATVRYYEHPANSPTCYRQGTWGLVALHIIQKTASAPYFTYATFEQADNITDSNGNPTEDPDGNLLPGAMTPSATTPGLKFTDTPIVNGPSGPPNVVAQPGPPCTVGKRLYYVDLLSALPSGPPICVNRRYNPIPSTIIAANRAAHAAIAAYNARNGIGGSPWSYYKLINVQYRPYSDETPTAPFAGNDPTTGNNPANFYLANIVVETNRPLQMFSGSLVGGQGGTGSNSNYDSQFNGPPGPAVHHNLYYTPPTGKVAPVQKFNMGGCMGCHGAQGQAAGGDFSVIFARGPVGNPEPLPTLPPTSASARRR